MKNKKHLILLTMSMIVGILIFVPTISAQETLVDYENAPIDLVWQSQLSENESETYRFSSIEDNMTTIVIVGEDGSTGIIANLFDLNQITVISSMNVNVGASIFCVPAGTSDYLLTFERSVDATAESYEALVSHEPTDFCSMNVLDDFPRMNTFARTVASSQATIQLPDTVLSVEVNVDVEDDMSDSSDDSSDDSSSDNDMNDDSDDNDDNADDDNNMDDDGDDDGNNTDDDDMNDDSGNDDDNTTDDDNDDTNDDSNDDHTVDEDDGIILDITTTLGDDTHGLYVVGSLTKHGNHLLDVTVNVLTNDAALLEAEVFDGDLIGVYLYNDDNDSLVLDVILGDDSGIIVDDALDLHDLGLIVDVQLDEDGLTLDVLFNDDGILEAGITEDGVDVALFEDQILDTDEDFARTLVEITTGDDNTANQCTATPNTRYSTINVRVLPTTASNVLTVVASDSEITVTGQALDGTWVEVDLLDGRTGFISASILSLADVCATVNLPTITVNVDLINELETSVTVDDNDTEDLVDVNIGNDDGLVDVNVGGDDGIVDVNLGGDDGLVDVNVGGDDGLVDVNIGNGDDSDDGSLIDVDVNLGGDDNDNDDGNLIDVEVGGDDGIDIEVPNVPGL